MGASTRRPLHIPDCPAPGDEPSVVHRIQFAPSGRKLVAWIGPPHVGRKKRPGTFELCWLDFPSGHVTHRTGLLNDYEFDPYPEWDPAVSPDLRIATTFAIGDGYLAVHDLRRSSGRVRDWTISNPEVRCFCFSPDAEQLLTVEVRGEQTAAFREPPACQLVVAEVQLLLQPPRVQPTENWIPHPLIPGQMFNAVGGLPKLPWQVLAEIPDRRAFVTAIAVSPDGKTVAVGSDRGTIWVFSATDGEQVVSFPAQKSDKRPASVFRLLFSPANDRLAVLSTDGISIHPLTPKTSRGKSRVVVKNPQDMVFTSDGQALLVTDSLGNVVLVAVPTGEVQATCNPGVGQLFGLATHPNGEQVVAGCQNGTLTVLHLGELSN